MRSCITEEGLSSLIREFSQPINYAAEGFIFDSIYAVASYFDSSTSTLCQVISGRITKLYTYSVNGNDCPYSGSASLFEHAFFFNLLSWLSLSFF